FLIFVLAFSKHATPLRMVIGIVVCFLALLFVTTIGRRAMKGKLPLQPGQQIALTGWQIVWVTVLWVAAGFFLMWLSVPAPSSPMPAGDDVPGASHAFAVSIGAIASLQTSRESMAPARQGPGTSP